MLDCARCTACWIDCSAWMASLGAACISFKSPAAFSVCFAFSEICFKHSICAKCVFASLKSTSIFFNSSEICLFNMVFCPVWSACLFVCSVICSWSFCFCFSACAASSSSCSWCVLSVSACFNCALQSFRHWHRYFSIASISLLTVSGNCCAASICSHCLCFSSNIPWIAANALFCCCNSALIFICSASPSVILFSNFILHCWSSCVFSTNEAISFSRICSCCCFTAIHSRNFVIQILSSWSANALDKFSSFTSDAEPQMCSVNSMTACFCSARRSRRCPAVLLSSPAFLSAMVNCAFFCSTSAFSGASWDIFAGVGWCVEPHTGQGAPSSNARARNPACASRNRCSVSLYAALVFSFSAAAFKYASCVAANSASSFSQYSICAKSFVQSCMCSAKSFCSCFPCK